MEEKKMQIVWYRFRGLGLLCLCSLVFFAGAYVTGQKSIPANSAAAGTPKGGTGALLAPVCSVETEKKQAALTFDVDMSSEKLQTILNILKQHGVKATFFVTGTWADRYPEDVKRICDAGHDIGSHSQSHADMAVMEKKEIQQEIQSLHETVFRLTGKEMKLFRAPYGNYGEKLLETVLMSGYMPVKWNIDSGDWKNYGIESIVERAAGRPIQNGSIILLHNEADYITQALEPLILSIKEQGCELVPLSAMIRWSGYTVDETGRQLQSIRIENSSA